MHRVYHSLLFEALIFVIERWMLKRKTLHPQKQLHPFYEYETEAESALLGLLLSWPHSSDSCHSGVMKTPVDMIYAAVVWRTGYMEPRSYCIFLLNVFFCRFTSCWDLHQLLNFHFYFVVPPHCQIKLNYTVWQGAWHWCDCVISVCCLHVLLL